jgi:hypothetical protein
MKFHPSGLAALLFVFTATAAVAAPGDRVFLRNDARLVQTVKGDVMTLRCERMGGPELKVKRWIRDCNTLARWELERMKREGQLGDTKLAREPLGEDQNKIELVTALPIKPGSHSSQPGPVAER